MRSLTSMAKTKKDGDELVLRLNQGQYTDFKDMPQEFKCLMAVGFIGGKTKKIHTEDIAIQLWKWLPEDYGFVKYPNKYPDKQMPKRGLTSIRTYEWVAGGMSQKLIEDGYKLTPLGIEVFDKTEKLLPTESGSKISRKEVSFLNTKIVNTKLFKDFRLSVSRGQNFEISEFDICDLLGSTPGLFEQTRSKFYNYINLAIKNEKNEVLEFLKFIESKHENILDKEVYLSETRNRKKL